MATDGGGRAPQGLAGGARAPGAHTGVKRAWPRDAKEVPADICRQQRQPVPPGAEWPAAPLIAIVSRVSPRLVRFRMKRDIAVNMRLYRNPKVEARKRVFDPTARNLFNSGSAKVSRLLRVWAITYRK